ncbi:alpha/beta fold hydrolase [Nocardia brasiliensis]|uniref:alpha/beta fold hydrolase n=1 Tax=Nocardia brasiliensis TaxID=37326 RepID=UPI000E03B5D6|nr:Tropinesterase [Nocardia brasiliensis]
MEISRRFFGGALAAGATSLAVATLSACATDPATSPAPTPPGAELRAGSGAHTTLGPIKQIDAGALNIGYAEFGPSTGRPVILLHGWPYDPYSFADVGPLLAAAGYRVLVPFLRGYGPTTFRSPQAVRNGQQSAIARDIVDFMDALRIDQAVLGGFDWGARTVDIIAALWPQRCKAIVAVSGYLITPAGGPAAAAGARSRTGLVVSVLLRHRARPRRVHPQSPRVQQADLATGLPAVELRRRHLRPQRRRVRQSRPRRDRDSQLPLAFEPGPRRGPIRRV